jgi:hypothetical protein
MFVVVHGLRDQIEEQLHLALEIVVKLSAASGAFSAAGVQFSVIYVDEE